MNKVYDNNLRNKKPTYSYKTSAISKYSKKRNLFNLKKLIIQEGVFKTT